jgi:hypothetical protein
VAVYSTEKPAAGLLELQEGAGASENEFLFLFF